MSSTENAARIFSQLKSFHSLQFLRELFQSTLDYDYVGENLSYREFSDTVHDAITEMPILLAAGGVNNDFHVIYTVLAGDVCCAASSGRLLTI
ncbi:MAG: hypothetical protein M3209_09435 [Acidobacteriota bacterium]|nr:hypothetical protein [Acidobacteriota bacterium]